VSTEVMEIIQRMDSGKLETQLVLQCSPLIVGLKMSNLFMISKEEITFVRDLLRDSKFSCFVLYVHDNKAAIFLYDRKKIERSLCRDKVRIFLRNAGYKRMDLFYVLYVLRGRYQKYRRGEAEFPHELGLLLGYPIEDVEGFIRNKGKKFLYTGYWKVYDNVAAKKDLFRMYELAKETLIQLVFNGVSIREILKAYDDNDYSSDNLHMS